MRSATDVDSILCRKCRNQSLAGGVYRKWVLRLDYDSSPETCNGQNSSDRPGEIRQLGHVTCLGQVPRQCPRIDDTRIIGQHGPLVGAQLLAFVLILTYSGI